MSTLLTIEADFLRNTQVETALDLRGIRNLQRTLANGQKKKFAQTLDLSKKVVLAQAWFASDEGKLATNEAGIYWNNETIGLKVFGWQKSYYYKVIKAGKLDDITIDKFNSLCDEAETQGNEPNRTLEGLLKFSRSGRNNTTETGENDGENDGENEPQIEVRVANVFTMTYKGLDNNVSVRIDTNNVISTTNTKDEILAAIEFLTNLI